MDKEDKRQFDVQLTDEKSVKISVRNPTNEELQEGEFEYSRAFNNAIVKGLMPKTKLLSALQDCGVWTEKDDEAIETQRQLVIRLEDALDKADDNSKERIGDELGEERQKLFSMRQARTEILSHCAEAKAEEFQRNYLVSRVSEYVDTGTRIWKTYEDYRKEENENLLFRTTYEYLTFINGLPSDFATKFPENQVKKEDEKDAEKEEDSAEIQKKPEESPEQKQEEDKTPEPAESSIKK